ncbi:MAG: 4Fe-4S dicluster domain-containing protein [Candidatus Omnitrophota bacterium]
MAKITIDREKCKGCLLCISVCPRGLICLDSKLNRKGIRPVKFSSQSGSAAAGEAKADRGCLACSMCAVICPDCCIEVWK